MKWPYQSSVILLGFFIIALPLVHLPLQWELFMHIGLGLLIMLVGVRIAQDRRYKKAPAHAFVETKTKESEQSLKEVMKEEVVITETATAEEVEKAPTMKVDTTHLDLDEDAIEMIIDDGIDY